MLVWEWLPGILLVSSIPASMVTLSSGLEVMDRNLSSSHQKCIAQQRRKGFCMEPEASLWEILTHLTNVRNIFLKRFPKFGSNPKNVQALPIINCEIKEIFLYYK